VCRGQLARGMAPPPAFRYTTNARSSRVQALALRPALCVGECVGPRCVSAYCVFVCVCACVYKKGERETDG
jgi:hypothetical protein